MVNNVDIFEQLKDFGLEEKQAKIYLALLQNGIQSPLELARRTGINRTTIYRLLDSLKEVGLVEEILKDSSVRFRAVEAEKLKLVIAQREAELEDLKDGLPELIFQLTSLKRETSSSTKVLYFRGKKGLQQLLWNTLKAGKDGEVLGFGYLNWTECVGRRFADKLRQEYVNREIYAKEILNSLASLKDFTEVEGYIGGVYESRSFPKSKIEINHDVYIYNNVFAFSHFYKDELFGVEIENNEIAKTQRQIFYLLWKMAKRL